MAYITLAQAKEYIGDMGNASEDDDTQLTNAIAAAQAVIEQKTGLTFEAESDAERTFDAIEDVDGRTLYLGDSRLCAITSITNGDGTAITADQYVTNPRRGTPYYAIKLLSSSGVSWTYTTDPEDAITIDGRWAYSVAPGADVKQACFQLAKWLFQRREASAAITQQIVANNGVIVTPAGMPPVWNDLPKALV